LSENLGTNFFRMVASPPYFNELNDFMIQIAEQSEEE
jgi:hypothetical protein